MKNIYKIAGLAFTLVLSAGFVACGGDSGTSAKDDDSSSSVFEKETSSDSVKNSSSSKVKSSSSTKENSSSSAGKYVCDIYTLSDALNCKCDENRLGKLAYNYDSNVELECIYDDYLNKYGWVTKKEESSSSSDKNSSSSVMSSSSSVAESSSSEDVVVSSSSDVNVVDPSTVVKGTMTDDRDGQMYKTVTIGAQTWMAENLNYAYNEPTSSLDSSSFCYNNSADSCAKYGRLYLWSAAMDSAAVFSTAGKGCGYGETCSPSGTIRGVCPEGWHLPSKGEWYALFTEVGGSSTAGKSLKSTSGWYSNGNGDDSFGFSVLPAGYYSSDYDAFSHVGDFGGFWSSYELYSSFADSMYFFYSYKRVGKSNDDKFSGNSVRCIKD